MAGRKSVYDEKIKCRFDDIERWLKGGATERQVAAALGIAYSTFNKYKVEKTELSDLLKSVDRSEIVCDLRSALIKKALGFDYEEKKTIARKIKFDHPEFGEIPATVIRTETTIKHAAPDVAALNLALKNYDKDNWANDPQMLDLKKQEMELRKQMVEDKSW